MSLKLLRDEKLPLLGSNQDSSDPESPGTSSFDEFFAAEQVRIASEHPRKVTKAPTKGHTPSGEVERYERRLESRRRTNLKTAFGMSVEEYDAILESQGGVCALCCGECKSGRRLSVDHCHASGRNRGLLCRACNIGLGSFRDDPDVLKRAAAYLIHHEELAILALRAAPGAPTSGSLVEQKRRNDLAPGAAE